MFRIERIKEEELLQIAALESKIFPDPWSLKSLQDTMREPHAAIFGAWEGEVLAGYLILYCVMDEGEIARIAVKESERRKGAAGSLLEEAERFARAAGTARFFLEVRESNKAAVTFYERHGFKRDGIRKKFYVNPQEDAILMSCGIV